MSFLSLKNINKIYPGDVQAVFDFSLDAEEGEFIILVGPSGCGKSTVLRMIAGLEEISSGDMFLEEKRVNDQSPSDRKIAMVFQDYALYGNMTVYQNIGFSLTVQGKSSQAVHDRVMDVSKTVELYDYLNRLPRALSGGQRQRVAMGRSLAKHARVLLMDEPLSNLDAKLRQQTRRELSILHNKLKPTIVYVTHDQIEAMTLASRIVVMNEGRIQQVGSPYEIYHWPENIFTASFIGSPPINLIKGSIKDNMFTGINDKNETVFQCRVPLNIISSEKTDKISETDIINNENIVMGLRAETVRFFDNDKISDDDYIFDAVVDTLEFLGAEYYASLNLNGIILTSRIPASAEIKLGQKIKAVFNINKAHFFDEVTGLRLRTKSEKDGLVNG
ncbi:MAG: ATP-binding cassette domain-containing protein [Treponema sp.]|nr:ATP-binding cassette domain-containing protein [Treponema sp.]